VIRPDGGAAASRLLMTAARRTARATSGLGDRADEAPAADGKSSSAVDRTAAQECRSAPPAPPPLSVLRRRRPVPNSTRDQFFSTAEQLYNERIQKPRLFFNEMRYINLRFTYFYLLLLTYFVTLTDIAVRSYGHYQLHNGYRDP